MPATALCSDESIALRAGSDFALLCPQDQKLVSGTDGAIAQGSWVLTSSAVGAWPASVATGQVVQLLNHSNPIPKKLNELLVVDSVSGAELTLRRKGMASGAGQAPGSPAALSGVMFLIATLGPQIEQASYNLDRRFGIDDLVTGRRNSDLYDPREAEELCVLEVLKRQYIDAWKAANDDVFKAKFLQINRDLDDLIARSVIHWSPASASDGAGPIDDSTNRFTTRLVRG